MLPELLRAPAVVRLPPFSRLKVPVLLFNGAIAGNAAPSPSRIITALLIAAVDAFAIVGLTKSRVELENTCHVPEVSVLPVCVFLSICVVNNVIAPDRASTEPVLLNGARMDVAPVPADLRNVPVLLIMSASRNCLVMD